MVVKAKRSPATARFAREKLEKELTIRFLVSKINLVRKQLEHILMLKGVGQRYIETHKLLSEVNHLCDQLAMKEPHRNMTFYARRTVFDKRGR